MTIPELIWQFVGFFTQTAPIALLMCTAFEESKLKMPRKKMIIFTLAALVAASAGFSLFQFCVSELQNVYPFSNLYMIVLIVIMTVWFFWAIRALAIHKISVIIILIHYAAMLFTINNIFGLMSGDSIFNQSQSITYVHYSVITNLMVLCITLPFVYLFLTGTVRKAMHLTDNRTLRRGCYFMSAAFALFCVVIFAFDAISPRKDMQKTENVIFLLAFMVTDIMLYYVFFSEARLAAENTEYKNQIKSFEEQCREINKNMAEAKRIRHDLRHHMNVINTLNQKGEYKALSEYIEAYSKSYSDYEDISACGYAPVDSVLSYYIGMAKEKGITVEPELHNLQSDMDFDVTDITVLFGNLMENAIESCMQLSDNERRFIRIMVKQKDVTLLIKIVNSCRADLESRRDSGGEGFISTKHSAHKGHGLKSICIAAEKYGGLAEFKRDSGMFEVRVVLNIP